jgi:excisionase family DNA binding protein
MRGKRISKPSTPEAPNVTKRILNSAGACAYLNVSRPTLTRLVKTGKISHFRVGVKLLFSQSHLDEFLARAEVKIA